MSQQDHEEVKKDFSNLVLRVKDSNNKLLATGKKY
jgi:hypothetical protein